MPICAATSRRSDSNYHHVPVTRGTKQHAEAELPGILRSACDGVVLARYIQILSGNFVGRVSVPVINIHHLFLPAFAGGEAYAGAKERASS